MYASIYTRLRAINSFLPDTSELKKLKQTSDIKAFEKRLKELPICQRFPMQNSAVEDYLLQLPYRLSNMVLGYLSGRGADFYRAYCRFYELEDIKAALHGRQGSYLLFLVEAPPDIQKVEETLSDSPWSEAWQKAYARYQDTHNIFDIEAVLDQFYYQHMVFCSNLLFLGTRQETQHFLNHWIDLKNRLWFHRLTHYYEMEPYHIKRLLIDVGDVFHNIDTAEGLTDQKYRSALGKFCYWQFKMNVLSLTAILAFSVYFQLRIKELLSVYYGKVLNFQEARIDKILGGT